MITKKALKEWSPLIGFVSGCLFLLIWAEIVGGSSNKVTTTKIVHAPVTHQWSRSDSLAFAQDQVYAEADKQFACLQNLWGKESSWNPRAKNLVTSQGMNAGGIPQLLGLSPLTPPAEQIRRGLRYINYRYITPCIAWQHWQKKGWY